MARPSSSLCTSKNGSQLQCISLKLPPSRTDVRPPKMFCTKGRGSKSWGGKAGGVRIHYKEQGLGERAASRPYACSLGSQELCPFQSSLASSPASTAWAFRVYFSLYLDICLFLLHGARSSFVKNWCPLPVRRRGGGGLIGRNEELPSPSAQGEELSGHSQKPGTGA